MVFLVSTKRLRDAPDTWHSECERPRSPNEQQLGSHGLAVGGMSLSARIDTAARTHPMYYYCYRTSTSTPRCGLLGQVMLRDGGCAVRSKASAQAIAAIACPFTSIAPHTR